MKILNKYKKSNASVENTIVTDLKNIKKPLTEKDVKQFHIDMETFSLALEETNLMLPKYLFNGHLDSISTEGIKDSIDNLVKWVKDAIKWLVDKTTEFYNKLMRMFNELVKRNKEVITRLNAISDDNFAKKLENYLNDYDGNFNNFDCIIDGKNFINFNKKFNEAQRLIDNIYKCVSDANTKGLSYIERLTKLPLDQQVDAIGDVKIVVDGISRALDPVYNHQFKLGTVTIGFDETTKKFKSSQTQGNVSRSVLEGTSKSSIILALSVYNKYKSTFEDTWNKKYLKELTRILDVLNKVNDENGNKAISAVKETIKTLIGIYNNINTFVSVMRNKLIGADRALLALANGIINAPVNKQE